jgi:hypothetical protein
MQVTRRHAIDGLFGSAPLSGRRRLRGLVAWIAFLVCLSSAFGQTTPPTGIPLTINEQEGPFSGTWTWSNGVFHAVWSNGAIATLTVQSFNTNSVMFNRADASGTSAGLTAVYTGQLSGQENSIINGKVTWTWPGHPGYPATGTWTATWTPSASFFPLSPSCVAALKNAVTVFPSNQLLTGEFASMSAFFAPNAPSLSSAAMTCGFAGFNWQQWIDTWPSPGSLNCAVPALCGLFPPTNLTAPPRYLDPVNGGYAGDLD